MPTAIKMWSYLSFSLARPCPSHLCNCSQFRTPSAPAIHSCCHRILSNSILSQLLDSGLASTTTHSTLIFFYLNSIYFLWVFLNRFQLSYEFASNRWALGFTCKLNTPSCLIFFDCSSSMNLLLSWSPRLIFFSTLESITNCLESERITHFTFDYCPLYTFL